MNLMIYLLVIFLEHDWMILDGNFPDSVGNGMSSSQLTNSWRTHIFQMGSNHQAAWDWMDLGTWDSHGVWLLSKSWGGIPNDPIPFSPPDMVKRCYYWLTVYLKWSKTIMTTVVQVVQSCSIMLYRRGIVHCVCCYSYVNLTLLHEKFRVWALLL